MAYFRNFFGGGGGPDPADDNGAEVVERLVERVETCTGIEDRRDALRGLRNLAKKHRLAVGTLGLNAFMDILTKERNAIDLLSLTLEVLLFVLNGDDDVPEEDELGERLAEVMLKRPQFISAVLATLEQYEFSVRRISVQLLTALLRHRGTEVQNAVIQQPMGVTRLVDLVHDNREVVRNEAILLLCELSRAHSQLQQLLAYDNAFSILIDIVETEPIDSIVIEDCLFVILNLLRKNANNQQLFRENQLILRLGGLLRTLAFPEDVDESAEWAKQRTANLIFLLQVIRALVSPDNVQANTHAAQKIMHQTQILSELCRVLLSEIGVSVEVLTETVIAVAEVIRGNYTNQEYFASNSLLTAEGSQRPALLVLLLSLTAERQPFKLRCAVFYAFLSYLHDNEFGKTKIVETLLPAAHAPDSLSTGSLVVQALTSSESVQSWFGAVCLLHCLLDVEHLGEQLLRVQLSLTVDEAPQPLLFHIIRMLINLGVRRPQQRSGLLQLLLTWCLRCPSAVARLVVDADFLNYLTAQIVEECGEGNEGEQMVVRGLAASLLLVFLQNANDEKTRSSLEALVKRRVGIQVCAEAVEGVAATESFVRAAQRPQPLAKTPGDLILDHHFVKLFKAHEPALVKMAYSLDTATTVTANNDTIIQSFKDLIKRQDEEISVLKTDYKRTREELEALKAHQASASNIKQELEDTRIQLENARQKTNNNEQLEQQIAHLRNINQQWVNEVEKYKQWAQQWQSFQISQMPNGGVDAGLQQLQSQVAELEQQLGVGWQAYEAQSQQMQQQIAATQGWKQRAEELEQMLGQSRGELEQLKANFANGPQSGVINGHATDGKTEDELRRIKDEQEDLLVLLADQHNKISAYRKRLKAMGQVVSEDEDEE